MMPHSNYILTANAEDLYEKTMLHRLKMKQVETSRNSCLDFRKLFINVFMTTTSNYTYCVPCFTLISIRNARIPSSLSFSTARKDV